MNLKEIQNTLVDKFAEPMKDGEKRKIIYWVDMERSFVEAFDEMEIECVVKHTLNTDNYFYTKYMLEEEQPDENFLIYTIEDVNNVKENWLIDNVLYSQRFFADEVSILIKDFGIGEEWRVLVSKNRKFFRNKDRYAKFKSFGIVEYSDEIIEIALISALCSIKAPDFEEALRKILMDSLNEEDNTYIERIEKFFSIERFWFYVDKYYGFKQEKKTLKKLMIHLMITRGSFDIGDVYISHFKEFIAESGKSNAYNFIDHWMNHKLDYASYNRYAEEIEGEIIFSSVLSDAKLTDFENADIFPVIDRTIIRYIVSGLMNQLEDYDEYISMIEARKTRHFYSEFKEMYEALFYVIKMNHFKKEHNHQIVSGKVDGIIERYTKEYYLMDYYYRKFYIAYDSRSSSEIMKQLRDIAENIYTNWYMTELSYVWTERIGDELDKEWRLPGQQRQQDFYRENVQGRVNFGDRVFVIVSDALRYEVAAELSERLNVEGLGSSELSYMVSALPSVTRLGMASLLPHKELQWNDNGSVVVDDMNSSGIENREKILQSYVEDSVAVDYKDFVNMNRSNMREFSKGKKLIYIYHDSIDAMGDKASTEYKTFEGAEAAVNELADLVKIIRDSLSGTNIFITADHGFIYQRDALEEVDKIKKEDMYFIESKRRYAISKEERDVDGLLRFSSKGIVSNDFNIYIPKTNIRFKTQGAGANFVHGGASLQEIVVPLISYKNKRAGQSSAKAVEKTKIKLTNATRKITNNIFTLNFFQTEKVADKIIPCSVYTYLVDEDEQVISNVEVIAGDKISSNPENRTFNIRFVLKALDYDKNKQYYLIIKDSETNVIYDKIPYVISLGIVSDFDF